MWFIRETIEAVTQNNFGVIAMETCEPLPDQEEDHGLPETSPISFVSMKVRRRLTPILASNFTFLPKFFAECPGDECMLYRGGYYKGERNIPLIHPRPLR